MLDNKTASDGAERAIFTQSTTKKDIDNRKTAAMDPEAKKPGIWASIWRGLAGL
jgi:hypothetical protein